MELDVAVSSASLHFPIIVAVEYTLKTIKEKKKKIKVWLYHGTLYFLVKELSAGDNC